MPFIILSFFNHLAEAWILSFHAQKHQKNSASENKQILLPFSDELCLFMAPYI
jgi:hypothetical protein